MQGRYLFAVDHVALRKFLTKAQIQTLTVNIPGIAKFPDDSERLAPPLRTAEKGPWLLMLPKRREGFIHL